VVGPAALPVHVPMPEDRVPDEAVLRAAFDQAAELPLGAAPVEAPPDDRVEARVPVPLPRVVAGAGPRAAIRHPVPLPLDPVPAQRFRGDRQDPAATLGFGRRLSQASSAACLAGRRT